MDALYCACKAAASVNASKLVKVILCTIVCVCWVVVIAADDVLAVLVLSIAADDVLAVLVDDDAPMVVVESIAGEGAGSGM
jgi:hypothetical protein